jgi:hypothetical protein
MKELGMDVDGTDDGVLALGVDELGVEKVGFELLGHDTEGQLLVG